MTRPAPSSWFGVVLVGSLASVAAWAYPTDEGERTGMRRLPWQQSVDAGAKKGTKTVEGGRWPGSAIKLQMTSKAARKVTLTADTPKDPVLQAGLEAILKRQRWDAYHVAVLDITDPGAPRYAGVDEQKEQTPGSVAKLLGAAALLDQTAKRFPKIADRERFLRETKVQADHWLMPNSHEVPVVDGDRVAVRAVRASDTFSLWEWLDHAISPSSNAAGTLVWREAAFMKLLGDEYPPPARGDALMKRWSRDEFSAAAFSVLDDPIRAAGLDPHPFRLRLFFTKGAGRYLKSAESRATPLAQLQWLLKVEQGQLVDEWASLELKKLMYLTRRRVRYVAAPQLKDSAVFFKSGSLYQCAPGTPCGKYRGTRVNVLNGLIEVETPAAAAPDGRAHIYLVAVMSNELGRNAASDHALLAAELHELIVGKRPGSTP